jgi:hypothetical protein
MSLNDMYTKIPEMREEFRGRLEKAADQNGLKLFLRSCLEQCESQFEEEVLTENLKEEFALYVSSLKKEG